MPVHYVEQLLVPEPPAFAAACLHCRVGVSGKVQAEKYNLLEKKEGGNSRNFRERQGGRQKNLRKPEESCRG